ncbi:coiled-coil protein [[Eubacterium] cellulosolvens]
MVEVIIKELETKRNRLNKVAEQHRKRRDKYNSSTKHWAENRTNLNERARNCLKDANDHKKKRDEINKDVQKAKKEREVLNNEYNKLAEQVNKVKRSKLPNKGVPLNKLKQEMKRLEFRQMTSVLSPDKERALIDELGQIQDQIKEREKELEMNQEIREAIQDAMKAKDKAELVHKRVGELAELAQNEHDLMVKLYEEANKCRKEADDAQDNFIENKEIADKEHNNHIFYIRQVHEYDKILNGIKRKYRKAKKEKSETLAKQQAEEIYERFKNGEKLSTEDLMCLQKAGYL